MKVMRPLVMALALISVGPAIIYAPAAEAAETAAIGESGLVEILPVPSIVADGETAVTVHVLAIGPNGAPFPGVKLKTDASTGETTDATDAGAGLYSFSFTPAKSTEDVEVTLSVKGKSATRAAVEAEYRLKVKGVPTGAIEGTANPTEIVLGKVDEATLTFQGGPKKGDMLVRVSGGEVTNMTNMGGGKHTGRFAAPKVNFPQFAIVTLADAANPTGNFGYQKVPLHGAVDYPVEASPNSSVMLKIEGKEYGPEKASPEGRAMVPVVVPPGVDKATLVTIIDGASTEKVIDLRVPPTRLLSLFPLPDAVPSDSSLAVPVRIVMLNPDGSPDIGASLSLSASSGTIGAAAHVKNGIYEAIWTPPESDESSTATIEVKVGDGKVQIDTMDVKLTPRRASVIALSTDAEEGAKTATVEFAVSSASGQPMSSQVITVNTLGASTNGAPEDGGGGKYTSEVGIETAGAKMGALIRSEPTGNAVAHVALVPSSDRSLNDGIAGTVLTIASVDVFGYPVANAEIALTLGSGGGQLPSTVTTDGNGISQIQYTAGKDAGLVRILASTTSGATGATSFVQAPTNTIPVVLPISGSKSVTAIHESWKNSAPVLAFTGGGDGGAVAAAAVGIPAPPEVEIGDPDADVASVEVIFWPEEVPPGATVLIRAIPKDADGKAIPGKTLDIMTSKGKVGDTVEEGAIYDTKVVLNDDVEGELKVSVVAGDSMKLVKVPVNPDADAVAMGDDPPPAEPDGAGPNWGSTEPKPAEEDPATPDPDPPVAKVPKVPKEAGEIPFFRARVSGIGSLYSYSQVPTEEPGPLLPQQLVVGGSSGGRAATPLGAEFNARVWVPDVPYVGAQANVRLSRYAIAAAEFNGEAPDWLNDVQIDVIGRYPFDVNGDQYWLGGKVGFHYNDFMIFTGCLDPGCQVNFDPLGLSGLGVGFEAGLEVSGLYAIAGFSEGLANFTVPYSTAVDVNVGYQFIPEAFADLGFTYMNRSLILEGTDSGLDRGELSDGQIMFKAGVGFSM